MDEKQRLKFLSWVVLVVVAPLTVYPAALVVAALLRKSIDFEHFLELRDILLLDLLLLIGMIDFTFHAALNHARRKPARRLGPGLSGIDYLSVAAAFLFLLCLGPIYGLSYPTFAAFSASRYHRLLRLELI